MWLAIPRSLLTPPTSDGVFREVSVWRFSDVLGTDNYPQEFHLGNGGGVFFLVKFDSGVGDVLKNLTKKSVMLCLCIAKDEDIANRTDNPVKAFKDPAHLALEEV